MTLRASRSLTRQVDALAVPPGSLALWALGQSGFVVKGGDTVVYIDPYLSNYVDEAGYAPPGTFPRQFPPPLLPEEATNAHWVFCTHEHADHTDPKTLGPLARVAPQARFIGPVPRLFSLSQPKHFTAKLAKIAKVHQVLTTGPRTRQATDTTIREGPDDDWRVLARPEMPRPCRQAGPLSFGVTPPPPDLPERAEHPYAVRACDQGGR